MTDFLDELHADLLADEQNRPRSQQVEIGGSGLFGCRAEHVLRLNGVPQSDPRLSWEAFVGSAIDHRIGEARLRRHPELIVQKQLAYRDVKFTVDEHSPSEKILRDWKSKDNAAACAEAVLMMQENRPGHDQKRAQLHGGAAALIAAGHEVDTIQLVFLPRSGGFDGARLFTEPFSREWADKGVEWAAEVIDIAEAVAYNPVEKIDGLRDKPYFFCAAYCPFLTACRGETGEPDTVEPDPAILDAAQRFLIARIEADEATQRRDYYRDMLRGAPPVVTEGWKVAWSRDTRETEYVRDTSVIDPDQWEFITGESLPVKAVTRGKAASLTPRKVRK
jgi:hypothetical protein